MKKKIVCCALFLSLGLLTTACKSKEDAPRTTGTESTEKVKPSEEPKQPEAPNTPEETKPVPKPSDYRIATRMAVSPIKEKTSALLRTLKLEEFIWGKDKNAIKLADLLPFVEFSASDLDGQQYRLTTDDLKLLQLVDLKYQRESDYNGNLTFMVRYNGINGKDVLRIPISIREYFLQKFEVNESFPKNYYLGGVAGPQFEIYTGSLLKPYDETKYALKITEERRADHWNNLLTFRGVLDLPRYGEKDVLTLDFELGGFKPLSALKDHLLFSTTIPLNEWMRDRLKKLKSLDDAAILKSLQLNPIQWIKLSSPALRLSTSEIGDLAWSEDSKDLVGTVSGGLDTRDVYLKQVHFEVKSAHYNKEAGTVTIDIALTGANDVGVSGVTAKLVVRSVYL